MPDQDPPPIEPGRGRLRYDKARRTIVAEEKAMMVLTMVRGDDWEGIYVNGELVTEGHSHDTVEAIKLALKHKVTDVEMKWADLEWLAEEGNLPRKLSDVKFPA